MTKYSTGFATILILLLCSGCSGSYGRSTYSQFPDPHCQIKCGIENIYGSAETFIAPSMTESPS